MRKRFASAILIVVLSWLVAGVLIGGFTEIPVSTLLVGWYVPSLGGLMLGVDVVRQQRDVVDERQRVPRLLRRRLASAFSKPGGPQLDQQLRALARQFQDAIFLTRVSCPRVPDWFYFRFRSADRADFIAAMEQLRAAIAQSSEAVDAAGRTGSAAPGDTA